MLLIARSLLAAESASATLVGAVLVACAVVVLHRRRDRVSYGKPSRADDHMTPHQRESFQRDLRWFVLHPKVDLMPVIGALSGVGGFVACRLLGLTTGPSLAIGATGWVVMSAILMNGPLVSVVRTFTVHEHTHLND